MQGTKDGKGTAAVISGVLNEKAAGGGVLEMPETDESQIGAAETDQEQDTPPAFQVNRDRMAKKIQEDKELAASLAARSTLSSRGNPDAKVADPHLPHITPRYDIVQNRSDMVLIVPDLKTNVEDMGLVLNPGMHIVLTDFYTPQEINRSKGLRYAATKLVGAGSEFALVPIASEAEASTYQVPERKQLPKGIPIEDMTPNDFDIRFNELEAREAKREEKLLRKTLGMGRTKEHGRAPQHV